MFLCQSHKYKYWPWLDTDFVVGLISEAQKSVPNNTMCFSLKGMLAVNRLLTAIRIRILPVNHIISWLPFRKIDKVTARRGCQGRIRFILGRRFEWFFFQKLLKIGCMHQGPRVEQCPIVIRFLATYAIVMAVSNHSGHIKMETSILICLSLSTQ